MGEFRDAGNLHPAVYRTLIFVPYFFTWRNMIGLGLSVSMVGMVACTMLFCLASGDFDLSVENIVAFSGVTAAVMINATGSIFLGVVSGILGGGLIGLINGTIIAKAKINALITTLAMAQIVRGLAFIVSGGSAVGVPDMRFFGLGNGQVLGIPNPIWITTVCFVIFGVLLNNTSYGKNTLAMGGNMEATRLAVCSGGQNQDNHFYHSGNDGRFCGSRTGIQNDQRTAQYLRGILSGCHFSLCTRRRIPLGRCCTDTGGLS